MSYFQGDIMNVVVVAVTYPSDIRVFKEINSLKERFNIHMFLTDTRKTSPQVEEYDSVTVHRFSHRSFSNKIIQYPFSFLRYIKIIKAAVTQSPHVCHVHCFPLLFAGIAIKALTGCKLIYDAHEDHASMIYQNRMVIINIIRKFELFLVKIFVDKVITVNQSLQSYFLESKVDTHILMNVPSLKIQENRKFIEKEKSDTLLIGYLGHIIQGRGYKTLIPISKHLMRSEVPFNILLVGGGPFKKTIDDLINENGLQEYFSSVGEVNHEKIPDFLHRIDIGLILFKPVRYNNIIATPNKLFEYMAFEIPIIASDLPEIRNIINETRGGILVNPSDAKQIAEKITYLYENPEEAKKLGKNGKKAFINKYNWENQEAELIKIYNQLI